MAIAICSSGERGHRVSYDVGPTTVTARLQLNGVDQTDAGLYYCRVAPAPPRPPGRGAAFAAKEVLAVLSVVAAAGARSPPPTLSPPPPPQPSTSSLARPSRWALVWLVSWLHAVLSTCK